MGGSGSGNWYRYSTKHDTTIGKLPLDVRRLHREGLLKPSSAFTSRWYRRDEPERGSTISGLVLATQVILIYRHRNRDGEWEDVSEPVRLEWTPCHFGGQRPWWTCPGVVRGVPCRRRVAVLYSAGKWFLCRHCYGLVYASQNEGLADRTLRKAQNIRERLGGSGSMMDLFPEKPKGMHWKTYLRWVEKGEEADLESWAALAVNMEKLVARFGRPPRRARRKR